MPSKKPKVATVNRLIQAPPPALRTERRHWKGLRQLDGVSRHDSLRWGHEEREPTALKMVEEVRLGWEASDGNKAHQSLRRRNKSLGIGHCSATKPGRELQFNPKGDEQRAAQRVIRVARVHPLSSLKLSDMS